MTIKNILTVDVEDWFHICGVEDYIARSQWSQLESRVTQNTSRILEILDKKKVKATFFVLGFVAERHPGLILKIQRAGHEIATHGYSHRQVYSMAPEEFRQDLKRAAGILTDITGKPVKGYRAPEWSIRDDCLWALHVLNQEGFEYDSSMAPLPIIGNPRYRKTPFRFDLDNGKLWEFPPLVASNPLVNLPLGGGWGLKILPYSLIRSVIGKLNKLGHPALIFVHPREFDPQVPRVRLPLIKRLVLHGRIESTEKRLKRLLDDFSFTSLSTIVKKMRGY